MRNRERGNSCFVSRFPIPYSRKDNKQQKIVISMAKKRNKKDEKKAKIGKRVELGVSELEQITKSTVQDMIDRGILAEDEETKEIDFPEEIEAKRKKREKEKKDEEEG